MPSIIFGLIAISLGLWGLSAWWWSVVEFLRGFVPIGLVFLGFIALGSGVTRLREVDEQIVDSKSVGAESVQESTRE
ncbi:hypothetical protein Mmc1_2268 [Magnetococcus marinus MC-1]|uniref:Magnetosome protein MamI n=1 Tax=Magnetococcus marinus (strain ATCC BAA-1437 / JCM 17883 / MC-1) TaxID=156889 RepID=A0L9X6_MAGMM|nr:magnetosome protein MamI [Magnetococcus marinus]ABK44769.1 hypothetical protein Mmc1_2268 [Magnetococcus marinus MC-1]